MWLDDPLHAFLSLLLVGALSGVFLWLDGKEKFTWGRLMVRAGASAMIGGAAAVTWIVYPKANIISLWGVACALGSFGTDRLERIVQKVIRRELP